MRTIDTRTYIDMLRGLTEEGKEVTLIVAGSSMSPFLIHHRDSICFRKPDRELRRGDMVFTSGPTDSMSCTAFAASDRAITI